MRHIAEGTAPGTEIAQYHESCSAFAEAFADVGTGSFLTYRVQLLLPQNPLDLIKLLAVGGSHSDPGRFTQQLIGRLRRDIFRIARGFCNAFLATFNCLDKEETSS
jgi:hypothetical protein